MPRGATTWVVKLIEPQVRQISSGGCWTVAQAAHCCRASWPDVNHARLTASSWGRAQSFGSSPATSGRPEQDGAPRRVAGARHRQAELHAVDLARRLAPHLSHRLDDVAEAVDVRLAEVAAARVDGQ